MQNEFTVLFDYDSMIYKALHKIASVSDMKSWHKEGRSKQWMNQEIINLTINRLCNMSDSILLEIEDTGINIDSVEYFLTHCPNSVRKLKSKRYKANRKHNKWVYAVRQYLLGLDSFQIHDQYEADDLIKDRAVELGEEHCIICSIDKDLKQIPGIHFDYYRPILKNPDGSYQLNENGFRKVAPCRGLSHVTKEEAEKFYWVQMLAGDSGDNITGIKGIGKVKAESILEDVDDYETIVIEEYKKHFKSDYLYQYNLHQLLIGLGVKHRFEKEV